MWVKNEKSWILGIEIMRMQQSTVLCFIEVVSFYCRPTIVKMFRKLDIVDAFYDKITFNRMKKASNKTTIR
jgi:hypothetical protein